MRRQIIKIVLLCLLTFGYFGTAHASLGIDTQVDVPASCTVTDTNGAAHSYGSSSYLAVCALDAATKSGAISSTQLSNQFPALGLFVAAINNVAANPSSQYWAIYQNGSYASSGITLLPVVAGDTIMFQLHDFSDNSLGDQVTIHIHSLVSTPVAASGPLITSVPLVTPPTNSSTNTTSVSDATPTPPAKPTFDVKKASQFLITQQRNDGSFGENLYTDWAAMVLASGDNQDGIIKLVKYLGETKINGTLTTDFERHAMALMSLGLNPYATNGVNYVGKIISAFDGKQFGDANEDNDDIFALIVLQNAGYAQNDKMISDDISFVLNRQKSDGSWDGSVDMTGAAVEALTSFGPTMEINNALTKAENFLRQNQKDDGSWSNASATAWVMEGILALNEKPENWIKNGNSPLDYLATVQDTDGGVKDSDMKTKIWETAYVASVLSGKTWNQLMQKFEKPETQISALMPKVSAPGPDIKISKLDNPAQPKTPIIENTAAVINSVTTDTTQEKTFNSNWFLTLLSHIFGL